MPCFEVATVVCLELECCSVDFDGVSVDFIAMDRGIASIEDNDG